MKINDCAVLVLSCDKYSDAWDPFFSFFFKNWPDCPYPVFLGTNFKQYNDERVKTILSECNKSWTEELRVILNKISQEFLIIILEDYFIYEKVKTAEIENVLQVMKKNNAAFTRLAAFPSSYNSLWPYNILTEYPFMGEIIKGSDYRVCLQIALWSKKILMQLLNENENPWQFETEASKRSDYYSNPFYCIVENKNKNYVHGPITYFCTAITKGVWMHDAIELCKKNNIPVDTSKRPVETKLQELIRKSYSLLPKSVKKGFEFISVRIK